MAPNSIDIRVLEPGAIERLIAALQQEGRTVVAPTLRDGAITLDEIDGFAELAVGLTTDTASGRYQVVPDPNDVVFGAAVGPDSTKRWQRPPSVVVWAGRKDGGAPAEPVPASSETRLAYIGVRACDLAARRILDRAAGGGSSDVFIVAVECTRPAPTCFCVSMGTGPGVTEGADLVITEIVEPAHVLVTRALTRHGESILASLGGRPATAAEEDGAWSQVAAAARSMTDGIDPDAAAAALRLPAPDGWDDVASRCLACGNCTMVCPTCFCTTTVDHTAPDGLESSRVRLWDSCFSLGLTELHGKPVRASIGSRYRQWISHKLSWWWDQYGTSGCVGCGRCIVWCPVGIDIRHEAASAVERLGVNA